jgi:hypothetical protein
MPEREATPLTATTTVSGATHNDVAVHETSTGRVMVQVGRGPVALQLVGTLSELQLLTVAVTDGLVRIGEQRGLEGRR